MPTDEKQTKKVIDEKKVEQEYIKHANLFSALSSFQARNLPAKKSAHVSFFANGREIDFWYAPLEEVVSAIATLLGANGLSFTSKLSNEGIETFLYHETFSMEMVKIKKDGLTANGELVAENEELVPVINNRISSGVLPIKFNGDMKDIGGQITYARRYTLALVLGIATEDDKDFTSVNERVGALEGFAVTKIRTSITDAKAKPEVMKSIDFIKKDLSLLEANKKTGLGLKKEQYEELLKLAQNKLVSLDEPKLDPVDQEEPAWHKNKPNKK